MRRASLSAVLAGATALGFVLARGDGSPATVAGLDLPALLVGGAVALVGATALSVAYEGDGVDGSVVVGLGPIVGLAGYLAGYHLLYPPSTDSPTALIALAFAAGVLTVVTVGHGLGTALRALVRGRSDPDSP